MKWKYVPQLHGMVTEWMQWCISNTRAGAVLTQFSDLEDLAQHPGELNGTAAKRAFVLVLAAAVLQDDLFRGDKVKLPSTSLRWKKSQNWPWYTCPGEPWPGTACCPRPASPEESGWSPRPGSRGSAFKTSKDVTQKTRSSFYSRCRLTHSEAQHLVVFSVHGLPLLCARGVIFSIKSNSTQLKNDVPLSLKHNKQSMHAEREALLLHYSRSEDKENLSNYVKRIKEKV